MDQYYMMQLAAEVRDCIPIAFAENYKRTDPQIFRLKLVTKRVSKEQTEEEKIAYRDQANIIYPAMFWFTKEMRDNLKPGESIQLGIGSNVKNGKRSKALIPNPNKGKRNVK